LVKALGGAALVLTLLLATTVLLLRARPVQNEAVRAILVPPQGCPAPCFLGIRPGVTSGGEAHALLEAHPWVDEVNLYIDLGALAWTWSGAQPDWIDATRDGMMSLNSAGIQYIRISTHIPFGDVRLVLGEPEHNLVLPMPMTNRPLVRHEVAYFGDTLRAVREPLRCPLLPPVYWQSPVDLLWRRSDETPHRPGNFDYYHQSACPR
jgi:hypothetical protein